MAIEFRNGMFSRWKLWMTHRARTNGGRTRRSSRKDAGSAKPTTRSRRRTAGAQRTTQGTRRRGGYTKAQARQKRSNTSNVGVSRRTHNPGRRPARTVRK